MAPCRRQTSALAPEAVNSEMKEALIHSPIQWQTHHCEAKMRDSIEISILWMYALTLSSVTSTHWSVGLRSTAIRTAGPDIAGMSQLLKDS